MCTRESLSVRVQAGGANHPLFAVSTLYAVIHGIIKLVDRNAFNDFEIRNRSLQWLAIVWGMHQAMPGIIFIGCVLPSTILFCAACFLPHASSATIRCCGAPVRCHYRCIMWGLRATSWACEHVQVLTVVPNGAAAAEDMGPACGVCHIRGYSCDRGAHSLRLRQ